MSDDKKEVRPCTLSSTNAFVVQRKHSGLVFEKKIETEASNAKIKGVYLYFFKRSISEDVFSGVKKFIFKNIGIRAHTKSNIYCTIFCPLWKALLPCFIYYVFPKRETM